MLTDGIDLFNTNGPVQEAVRARDPCNTGILLLVRHSIPRPSRNQESARPQTVRSLLSDWRQKRGPPGDP